ncbi:MAG: UDP-N-acetylmuramate dehydrogenase [Halioglobus sp.]|nr:UDP-N-acetylmuramate dehydrogenase [Halioglobus sp.]
MTPGERVPLQQLNTLRLPSTARAFTEAASARELLQALEWAAQRRLPVIPLGGGSNVVLAGDLEALVLQVALQGIQELGRDDDAVLLRVAAGQDWHDFVQWSLVSGFYGLENLALIPGNVGAAPIQNIGAYGVEVCTFLQAVHGVHIDSGDAFELGVRDCRFDYRDSIFKHDWQDGAIITAVDLRLPLRPEPVATYPTLANYLREGGVEAPTAQQVFDAVVRIRSSRLPDPALTPNAGSFFKNPVLAADEAGALAARFDGLPCYPHGDDRAKVAAAWMIEHCGWKGRRQGPVGVHPEHALVLVNYDGGSGAQLLALARAIADDVRETFGVQLLIEPRVLGEDA